MAVNKPEKQALDDALPTSTWMAKRVVPMVGTTTFFAVLTHGEPVLVSAIGIFWGLGIVKSYYNRVGRLALGTGQGQRPELTSQVERTPSPSTPARIAEIPASVADIARQVQTVAAGLRRLEHTRTADRLEAGMREVGRLAALTAVAGPEPDDLRAEIAALHARAEATTDPEARELWRANAQAAEHRLAKALALAAATDRTHARIEAFRQAVKSLAVDLARLDLSAQDPGALTAVEEHALALERDVEALTRTHTEISQAERASAGVNAGRRVGQGG